MPAKLLKRANDEGSLSRIYNYGTDSRNIFDSPEDYRVFLGFLSDYLTAPKSSEEIKKEFTVNGRSFHGVPHQPKNYLNQVELIAYRLLPDRFDFVLKQLKKGTLEKFMRSLSTRYSIYFNKKYHRTGTVFAGPYKSSQVKDECELLSLTRLLHRASTYSSFPDYTGKTNTPWVNPGIVLNCFEQKKNDGLKEFSDYKDFVEKDEPGETVTKPIEPVAQPVNVRPHSRFPEYAAATAVFLVLLGLGVKNIKNTEAATKSYVASVHSTNVLSESTIATPTPAPAITKIIVRIPDASSSANIRQSPSLDSNIIGRAVNNEVFDSVSSDSGWYGIKMPDGSTGFITSKYIEIYNNTNK